ncbi:hypothetical protein M8J76_008326 [Diaphorina citri]|nr:hypothetical protein M8J75_009992 [Diaphorina citri]KAI5740899.1 hypothetical protein M8J76_008326 [Diaphorina citri]KAI5746549.1 hypothetical protein M8J77_004767 [Diaphorina citri]
MSSEPTETDHGSGQSAQLGLFIHGIIQSEKHISPQVKRYIMNNFDAILSVLTKNVCFKKLFQSWTNLSPNQRTLLDEQALSKITTNYQFYVTLKCVLVVWEYIQDHYGAPGYEYEDKKEDLHQSDAEVLSKVDKIIAWICKRNSIGIGESKSVQFQSCW